MSGDCAGGVGKFEYPDHSLYEGSFEDSRPHGYGIRAYADGSLYDGEFDTGRQHGYGRLRLKDGDVYSGLFQNNRFDGYGRYVFAEQSRNGPVLTAEQYAGAWSQNARQGWGVFVSGDGKLLVGEFNADVGQGAATFIGLQRNGRFDYNVICHGAYRENKLNGEGICAWSGGRVILGSWRDDRIQEGTLIYEAAPGERPAIYSGEFADNLPNGTGRYWFGDGRTYEGEFRNGRFEGSGELVVSNPDYPYIRYQGEFADHQFHGEGTLYLRDGRIQSGRFQSGRFQSGQFADAGR